MKLYSNMLNDFMLKKRKTAKARQQLIQETKTYASSFDVMKNELLNEIKEIKQSMKTFEEKMNVKM